jgi:hypothetical protein
MTVELPILNPNVMVAMAMRAAQKQKPAPDRGANKRGKRCLKCKRKLSGANPKNLCRCGEKEIKKESSPVV